MNQYDTTLKLLLKSSGRLIQALIGAPVVNWLRTELPKVQISKWICWARRLMTS